LGQTARAIEYHEKALAIMREVGDRHGEGITLGNLGLSYSDLGQTSRAIEYYEQALAISREVGDRRREGYALFRLAQLAIDEGRHEEAIRQATEAVRIGEETGDPMIISAGNETLALVRLTIGDLPGARAAAEAARATDVPLKNHNVLSLLGLIALRQGDRAAAAEAFSAAAAHAGVMLERCEQNYNALDAKGLAMAGLAVIEGAHRAAEAIAAFRAARAITSAPGHVSRLMRLLDALKPADEANILAAVYEAATGRDVNQAAAVPTRPSP
jgi:tetratricopeptide (TPR) repeat protein